MQSQNNSVVTPQAIEQAAQKGKPSMLITLILILIPTITGVAGQLLLKIGMTQLGVLELSLAALPNLIWRVITSPQVIIGLAIYLGGVFFWLLALNRAELSFVYPFASLSYVLITIVSWGILHEHVSPQRWLAMLIICLGVIMVVRS
jgi:drug/metabolite transporter (DMT)-like permease